MQTKISLTLDAGDESHMAVCPQPMRILFKDNQPHINWPRANAYRDCVADVTCSLRASLDMLALLELVEILDHYNIVKSSLVVPYLLGARSDRRMTPADSVDLKVIAKLINSCLFDRVILHDVHSDVALQLIDRSTSHSMIDLMLDRHDPKTTVLVFPDAGATKRYQLDDRFASVFGAKVRDSQTGQPAVILQGIEQVKPGVVHRAVIVDDLCDGGRTFIAVAKALPSFVEPHLCITHGLFTNGFGELSQHFASICTTDSYYPSFDEPRVKVFSCRSWLRAR